MKLTKITTEGVYWLKAENKKDEISLNEFANDVMIDNNSSKKIGVDIVTFGKNSLPIRIQINTNLFNN